MKNYVKFASRKRMILAIVRWHNATMGPSDLVNYPRYWKHLPTIKLMELVEGLYCNPMDEEKVERKWKKINKSA